MTAHQADVFMLTLPTSQCMASSVCPSRNTNAEIISTIPDLQQMPVLFRLVFEDAKHGVYLYNAVNDQLLQLEEASAGLATALWDAVDPHVFLLSDGHMLFTYLYSSNHLLGSGKTPSIAHSNSTALAVNFCIWTTRRCMHVHACTQSLHAISGEESRYCYVMFLVAAFMLLSSQQCSAT